MKLVIECSIDLDQNRKVWISGTCSPEPEDDVTEVIGALSVAVREQALEAYRKSTGVSFDEGGPDLRTMQGDS
jgi:hypothetical protein